MFEALRQWRGAEISGEDGPVAVRFTKQAAALERDNAGALLWLNHSFTFGKGGPLPQDWGTGP